VRRERPHAARRLAQNPHKTAYFPRIYGVSSLSWINTPRSLRKGGKRARMFPFAVSLTDRIETWSLTWLPILLMVALVYLIWRTLRMMPRTKPQQIRPEGSGSIRWDDVAGCEEAKDE